MPLQWTEDLSVGIEEIDAQHKELFRRINTLFDAMKQGKGRDEIDALILFLDDYVVMHFAVEERHMIEHSYPDYSFHKTRHSRFAEEYSGIKRRFMSGGPTADLVTHVNHVLTDWWLDHIRTVDKLLGVFLVKTLSKRTP
jgi:hemerythrin